MAPRIGIISVSPISDDPRVCRQAEAFARAGRLVTAFGLPGAASPPSGWSIRTAPAQAGPPGSLARRAFRAGRLLAIRVPAIGPALVDPAYWALNPRFRDVDRLASEHRPDLWLANDWTALPIADRLAAAAGVPFAYDTHELAADEYYERLRWRILHRPLVVAVEQRHIRRAAFVTCVSEGIATRLRAMYGLSEQPMVVRNTPAYRAMPFRPVGDRIRVLYHGVVAPGRGLEACIRSVRAWRPEFELTIRGPAEPEYRRSLEALAEGMAVADRVHLVPPVPMAALVKEANGFDVGLFALPDHSRHNRYALPNKVFEYAMAGLALCVSALPEMAGLVARHDLGRTFSGLEPAAIAAAINALDRDSIDVYKRHALRAAQVLNWERESEAMIARCAALIER